jgi:hypothetical protein
VNKHAHRQKNDLSIDREDKGMGNVQKKSEAGTRGCWKGTCNGDFPIIVRRAKIRGGLFVQLL